MIQFGHRFTKSNDIILRGSAYVRPYVIYLVTSTEYAGPINWPTAVKRIFSLFKFDLDRTGSECQLGRWNVVTLNISASLFVNIPCAVSVPLPCTVSVPVLGMSRFAGQNSGHVSEVNPVAEYRRCVAC